MISFPPLPNLNQDPKPERPPHLLPVWLEPRLALGPILRLTHSGDGILSVATASLFL